MMKARNLNPAERQVIRSIVDDAGLVPLLREVATMVAADHPDRTAGWGYQTTLIDVARRLEAEPARRLLDARA